MSRQNKVFQVLISTKIAIDLFPVSCPIAMVPITIWCTINLVYNWTDPDGIEPHSTDVVKIILKPFERSTTVVTTPTSLGAVVILSKSVRKNLIDSF
jgi:hypothetical protein